MQSQTFVVNNKVGLHARPAALFVQTVGQFQARVTIKNNTRGTAAVDARSIISVLSLGIASQHEIEISAEGDDENEAMQAISELVHSNFQEEA